MGSLSASVRKMDGTQLSTNKMLRANGCLGYVNLSLMRSLPFEIFNCNIFK